MTKIEFSCDADYAIEAEVVDMGAEQPYERSPYPGGGGVALLLHWRHPQSGAVLPILVTAPARTPMASAMCGVEIGDVLRVEGSALQLYAPRLLGELVLMRSPRYIRVARRATTAPPTGASGRPATGRV